jgi:hypothetical protein
MATGWSSSSNLQAGKPARSPGPPSASLQLSWGRDSRQWCAPPHAAAAVIQWNSLAAPFGTGDERLLTQSRLMCKIRFERACGPVCSLPVVRNEPVVLGFFRESKVCSTSSHQWAYCKHRGTQRHMAKHARAVSASNLSFLRDMSPPSQTMCSKVGTPWAAAVAAAWPAWMRRYRTAPATTNIGFSCDVIVQCVFMRSCSSRPLRTRSPGGGSLQGTSISIRCGKTSTKDVMKQRSPEWSALQTKGSPGARGGELVLGSRGSAT